MTLEELNSNEILEEKGVLSFLKNLVNKTKKFKDGTTEEQKEEYIEDKISMIVAKIKKVAPRLREWEDKYTVGNKISKGTAQKVIDGTNASISKMRPTLQRTPEKALNIDIDKVANAIVNNSVKKVTGSNNWSETDWFTALASKVI